MKTWTLFRWRRPRALRGLVTVALALLFAAGSATPQPASFEDLADAAEAADLVALLGLSQGQIGAITEVLDPLFAEVDTETYRDDMLDLAGALWDAEPEDADVRSAVALLERLSAPSWLDWDGGQVVQYLQAILTPEQSVLVDWTGSGFGTEGPTPEERWAESVWEQFRRLRSMPPVRYYSEKFTRAFILMQMLASSDLPESDYDYLLNRVLNAFDAAYFMRPEEFEAEGPDVVNELLLDFGIDIEGSQPLISVFDLERILVRRGTYELFLQLLPPPPLPEQE